MFISEMLILYEQTQTSLVRNQDIFQPVCFHAFPPGSRSEPHSTPATLALISFVFAMSWKVGKSVLFC